MLRIKRKISLCKKPIGVLRTRNGGRCEGKGNAIHRIKRSYACRQLRPVQRHHLVAPTPCPAHHAVPLAQGRGQGQAGGAVFAAGQDDGGVEGAGFEGIPNSNRILLEPLSYTLHGGDAINKNLHSPVSRTRL